MKTGNQKRMRYNKGHKGSNRYKGGQNRPKKIISPLRHTFESNGPNGRIRGNAQQLIEKYTATGHELLGNGDRVLAENCFQFADHYSRLIQEFNEQNAQTNQETSNKKNDSNEENGLDADIKEEIADKSDYPSMSAMELPLPAAINSKKTAAKKATRKKSSQAKDGEKADSDTQNILAEADI